MEKVTKIKAFLNLESKKQEIGEMVLNHQTIYFKYDVNFIESGLEISPFKLKLTPEIVTPKEKHFDGLFGVFADSTPDGWGRLLVDRKLTSLNINLNDISALDRLAFLDNNSIGAISYEPEYADKTNPQKSIDLDAISSEINTVLNGNSGDIIDDLFQLGGSSGGARPKILVSYNAKTDELLFGENVLPEDFEHWIIKFPSSNDLSDCALIEYTYNEMAKNAGIEVNEFKLFQSKSGKYFFGSKRFDRIKNQKVHLHSAAGLLHDNFRMSTLDYGHLMDCAFQLEKDVAAYQKIIRLAIFNVLAHNRDDHSKNFSFLMDNNGNWKLAPAYDLTFSTSSFGMHSTAVFGESKNPNRTHIKELSKHFLLKNPDFIIDEVQHSVFQFETLGKNNGISKNSLDLIKKQLSKI